MAKKPADSEVDAYLFIKENLKLLGWDTRNPARNPSGQVYTQGECLSHPEMKRTLVLTKPENVVKITESIFWVIEAKRSHKQLAQALNEAADYARDIAKGGVIKALFISGVAGNQTDGYLVQTKYLVDGKYEPISFNGKDITSLISPEVAKAVLENGREIKDVPVDEALFVSKAEKINQILHLGAINKDYRARVMAALLLSLVDDTPPNVDAAPTVLVKDINARAEEVLRSQSRVEFYEYIRLSLPASKDNHPKFKAALVQTIQELQILNIRSAMNSGTDILGKFYEVFLKYGNGAKEIGIVLTPRHITEFAVEALNVTDKDIVYDPCCGTGGFLIAAFDHVKKNSNEAQIDRFKQNNLFGVDQESAVVSLAIVNMIFRGDGKNNIIEGNSFQNHLKRHHNDGVLTATYERSAPSSQEAVVSRVLMNPPFALKSSDEKEYKFVDHALAQMEDGGILFALLPYSAMARSSGYEMWRRSMLNKHTLLSAITLPPDLFYPVSVHTVGIFLKKGMPHPPAQNVLWLRAVSDGLVKMKGKRLPSKSAENDYPNIIPTLRGFIVDPKMIVPDIDRKQKASPIDMEDPLLELVPENYLEEADPSGVELAEGIEDVMRNALSYMVRSGRGRK